MSSPQLFDVSITWISKPDKTLQEKNNCRPVFLMKKDIQIINKILVSPFQQCVKTQIHHGQEGFMPGMPSWLINGKLINVILA